MAWGKNMENLNQLNIGSDLEHIETLTSSVTTSWGVEWSEELIARDIMQNFFDANRNQLSDIKVNIEGSYVSIIAPTVFDLMRLACPRWLKKRMRKNLKAAARSKINSTRAKKALQILVFNKKKQKT